ncbi:MAG TPA: aminotransferase class I/II-fold pyridoxal phosphate-dependent enzyme, partial [Savagea sp.]
VDEFSKALLEEANVAVIPGSAFGSSTTIRLSYATSIQALREAIQRIQNFVEQKWQD